MTGESICPICRGGITSSPFHHQCLLRLIGSLPRTVDGVPIVPGMEVFAFTDDCRRPGQPRPGHVVRITNGSDRVTLALRAPSRQQSTHVSLIYADCDEAWIDKHSPEWKLS